MESYMESLNRMAEEMWQIRDQLRAQRGAFSWQLVYAHQQCGRDTAIAITHLLAQREKREREKETKTIHAQE